ncbi:hypothetical protein CCACVL1_22297 [Corchorus capsularis]|uniref:Uncharacterized protein n=1 Tax=Corchorus capsularis TaxID=210143 RepID=A0A1R3H0B6_COCAP|nr:hypothetical protein CCACVL1_22297 [Corchorus capsularis]
MANAGKLFLNTKTKESNGPE